MFGIEFKSFNFFNPKNKSQMKNAKLSAILGREVMVGETLNAEETAQVTAHLESLDANAGQGAANNGGGEGGSDNASAGTSASATQETVTPNAELTAAIQQAVSAGLAPILQTVSEMNGRLQVVEGSAGASATDKPVTTGAEANVKPWEDPNSPINQQIEKDLAQ